MLLYAAFIITPEVPNQGFLSVIQHCTAMPTKSIFRINIKKINIQRRHKPGKFFLYTEYMKTAKYSSEFQLS